MKAENSPLSSPQYLSPKTLSGSPKHLLVSPGLFDGVPRLPEVFLRVFREAQSLSEGSKAFLAAL